MYACMYATYVLNSYFQRVFLLCGILVGSTIKKTHGSRMAVLKGTRRHGREGEPNYWRRIFTSGKNLE